MDPRRALEDHGLRATAQRLAVARYLLATTEHPTADRVWERVRTALPTISRATVYNTLSLFVERGLIRSHQITEGATVYDPRTEPHHHLVDERTGAIVDIPWDALSVRGVDALEGFEVSDYQVVLRGTRQPAD